METNFLIVVVNKISTTNYEKKREIIFRTIIF